MNEPQDALSVPCGSCRACCRDHQAIVVDDSEIYDAEAKTGWIPKDDTVETEMPGVRLLRHQPNGDCIYLTEKGCGIWPNHPKICRVFDCRAFVRHFGTDSLPEPIARAALNRL